MPRTTGQILTSWNDPWEYGKAEELVESNVKMHLMDHLEGEKQDVL